MPTKTYSTLWLVSLIMLLLITKINLEQMTYEAMFSTEASHGAQASVGTTVVEAAAEGPKDKRQRKCGSRLLAGQNCRATIRPAQFCDVLVPRTRPRPGPPIVSSGPEKRCYPC
jgi:hypothetical protein